MRQRSVLVLEAFADGKTDANSYRTIIKTSHARIIYLSLVFQGSECSITNCFYADRNQSRIGEERYRSRPLMLRTVQFPIENLLQVIETELDKKFYGVTYVQDANTDLPIEDYLKVKLKATERKYRFLIMVGSGELYNGLPVYLRTRLKNNLHRSVYIELAYYKDGMGVVKQCYYYDREYQRQEIVVTPPLFITCFFPYDQDGILQLMNNELCCTFTHILVTADANLDLDNNLTPLCGAV